MNNAITYLPEEYQAHLSIDLQNNKKLALFLNALAFVIAAVMGVAMHLIVPIGTFFDMSKGFGNYLLRFGVMLVAMIAYIILHELVHGIAMKLCGTKKVRYGFTGLYAFAGSDDYYDKRAYIFIALAPIVLWGIVLFVVNILVPTPWFWVVYIIQIINISGAAGDLYVTLRFSKLPKDILIRDIGTSMTVFTKE